MCAEQSGRKTVLSLCCWTSGLPRCTFLYKLVDCGGGGGKGEGGRWDGRRSGPRGMSLSLWGSRVIGSGPPAVYVDCTPHPNMHVRDGLVGTASGWI